MNKKTILVIYILLGSINLISAQINSEFKITADKFLKKENYFAASQYYEKALQSSSSSVKLIVPYTSRKKNIYKKASKEQLAELYYKLGESYRLNNNYSQAKMAYKHCIDNSSNNFPLSKLWYGITLRATGETEQALVSLKDFLNNHKTNDQFNEKANLEIESCLYKLAQKKSNYANKVGVKSTAEVFYASYHGDANTNMESKFNPISSSQTIAGLTAYITKWESEDFKLGKKSKIYKTTRKTINDTWGNPSLCESPINMDGFSSRDPFITKDGKYLLFSSNRGGNGSYDLWMIKTANESNKNTQAINLGSTINSNGDEVSPYYDEDAHKLYFSSNGRVGMGGLDIYSSIGSLEKLNFSNPMNLGAGVNSIKDDLYYSKLNSNAFVVSDRATECCLELFKISPINRNLKIIVLDNDSKKVIQNSSIEFKSEKLNNESVVSNDGTKTNNYKLDESENSSIHVSSPGYEEVYHTIQTPFTDFDTTFTSAIYLKKKIDIAGTNPKVDHPKKTNIELLDSIRNSSLFSYKVNYAFNEAIIRKTDFKILDSILSRLKENSNLHVIVASYADCRGTDTYNIKLSQNRSNAVYTYLVNNGVSTSRINTTFFGKEHLISGCDLKTYNQTEQIINRRSEIFLN